MANEQCIKIGSKTYRAVSLDDITLDDVIMLDTECKDAGYGDVTFDDIEAWAERLDTEDPPTTRQAMIVTAVTVWLMKRAAGEACTLKEAAKTPAGSIQPLAAPEDKAAPKARRKSSPKASALASVPPADERATDPAHLTSEPQSASA